MEPQYVFGAATAVGTRIQKSSQDTTPSADNARNPKAEKNEKTALRGSLSLDKRGPHTCSAQAWGESPPLLVAPPWCLPSCCHLFVDGLGQEPLIPDLLEVMIVGERLPYSTVSHHDKRCAVRETEGFVSVPLEHLPGFVFPLRRNTDDR